MIFKIILSGSILHNDPTTTILGCVMFPWGLFRTIKGRGGKEMGANTEATENRPACKNLSILCLPELMLSEENIGLQKETKRRNKNLLLAISKETLTYNQRNPKLQFITYYVEPLCSVKAKSLTNRVCRGNNH